jgi:hypothetical protein
MRKGAYMIAAAALSLAACSGGTVTGLDQVVYNATYKGPANFWIALPSANTPPAPAGETMLMTLSQLGRDFTGDFVVADSLGQPIYSGSVSGRATSTGGDFTFVIPATCAGTMYGAFTVSNGALDGTADGRNCGATVGSNVHITFTNLVRQ